MNRCGPTTWSVSLPFPRPSMAPPHLVEQYKFDTLWINLSAGPEAVLNGMKRKSRRYEIRHAEKMLNRVAIEVGSEKANRDFLKVYSGFTRAKGLPGLRPRWIQDNSAYCETLVLYLDTQPHLQPRVASRSRNKHREAALFRQSTSGISRAVSSVWHAESLLALARECSAISHRGS